MFTIASNATAKQYKQDEEANKSWAKKRSHYAGEDSTKCNLTVDHSGCANSVKPTHASNLSSTRADLEFKSANFSKHFLKPYF